MTILAVRDSSVAFARKIAASVVKQQQLQQQERAQHQQQQHQRDDDRNSDSLSKQHDLLWASKKGGKVSWSAGIAATVTITLEGEEEEEKEKEKEKQLRHHLSESNPLRSAYVEYASSCIDVSSNTEKNKVSCVL